MSEDKIYVLIEKILSSIESKYICKIWVDPEMDDDAYWINIVFNSKFMELEGHERLHRRTEIANIIENKIRDYFDVKVFVGTTVDQKC
jgi:hypothetical protein